MKRIYLLASLFVCVFSACQNVEKTDNIAPKVTNIKVDLAEKEDLKVIRWQQVKRGLSIRLKSDWDGIPFGEQLKLLPSDLSAIEAVLRTENAIFLVMKFLTEAPEVRDEFSKMPLVQKHLQEKVERGQPFLDHRLLGKALINSPTMLEIAAIFEEYQFQLDHLSLEKCHERWNEKEGYYYLNCAHFNLKFEREE